MTALREWWSRQAFRWAALVSVVLHAAVLAALLITIDRKGRTLHDAVEQAPTVQLVMVERKGSGHTEMPAPREPEQAVKPAPATPPAAPTPPIPPSPQPPTATKAPPPPSAPPPPPATASTAVPLPPPAPATPTPSPAAVPPLPKLATREAASPPSPARPPAAASAVPPSPKADASPRINLGGTDSLSNADVTGGGVVPAGLDTKVHNQEPIYPDGAVLRGQQGAVVLAVAVSPEGLASGVDVFRSSGFALLDHAARDAVATWHFMPAVRDGQPIPSSMLVRVVFTLD